MADEATSGEEGMDPITIDVENEEFEISLESAVSRMFTSQDPKPALIDIRNKMAIIYNVLQTCMDEKKENAYYYLNNTEKRLAHLTKLPSKLLTEIMLKTKKYTVLDQSLLETPDQDLDIRQTLIEYYIHKNTIPRAEFLKHIVLKNRYSYNLNTQLKRSGYIWRRLPKTKKAIIIEHPKRSIERQRYLQKIMRYRNENRNVVYIETKILTRADEDTRHFIDYLGNYMNYILIVIAVANNAFLKGEILFFEYISECQKLVEGYIVKNIIPCLDEPSVIILEDKPYFKKTLPVPTIKSEKSEMIKWLEINKLPHNKKDLHRCELFELIQKCKNKSDLHEFDAILYSHGHEILRRPSRTDYLNYYKILWATTPPNVEIISKISEKKLEFWKNLEKTIIQKEKLVLEEDLLMETITDKILTMARDTDVTQWADVECDEEIDSLDQEEIIIDSQNTFSADEIQTLNILYIEELKKFERVRPKSGYFAVGPMLV